MKKTTSLYVLLSFFMLGNAQLPAGGVYTVGVGGTYTSLKAAFDAINAQELTGDVTLNIISDLTETANPGLVNNTEHDIVITGDSENRTVTFDDGGVLITNGPAGAIRLGTKGDWNLIPAKNITIQNLTLITASTQHGFNGPISINGACNNVKIDNCVITHNGKAGVLGTNNLIAVALRTATDADAGGNIMPSNTTVSNCRITSTATSRSMGITAFSSLKGSANSFVDGMGGAPSEPKTLLSGLTVSGNIFRVQRAGVMPHFIDGSTVVIDKNEFYINQTESLLSWGVFIDNGKNKLAPENPAISLLSVISNNKFLELKAFSDCTEQGTNIPGVEAIHVGNRSYALIFNNFITGFEKTNPGNHLIKFRGVYLGSGTYEHGVLFYHNTVVLNELTNKPAFPAAPKSGNTDIVYSAITLGGYTYNNAIDLVNNIFISKEDECYNFLIHESGTGSLNRASRTASDYNVMHLTAGNNKARILFNAYEDKMCTNYNEYFSYVQPMDGNGVYWPVTFVKEATDGTADLHLAGSAAQISNFEVPAIAAVPYDIDGHERTNPTYAGADHYRLPNSVNDLFGSVDMKITRIPNGFKINFTGNKTVALFSVNGMLIERTQVSNEYIKTIGKGIYILKIDDKSTKIIL